MERHPARNVVLAYWKCMNPNETVASSKRSEGYEAISHADRALELYAAMIYRIALARVKNPIDADDVFQEVFLRYMQNQKPFASEEHEKAWLIRVAVNCCKHHFFTASRHGALSFDEMRDADGTSSAEPMYESDPASDAVREAIMKLPGNLKDVIILFYYENMSVKEISRSLGTTEANVKMRLSRARKKLKLDLE